ncbi:MAG: YggT family protein [Alphaproteobacteria bacterium]
MPIEVLQGISFVLTLYSFLVLAHVLSSWLIMFGVLNVQNDTVRACLNFIAQAVEPVLGPIRNGMNKLLPDLGGIDLSPIVLLLGLGFLRSAIWSLA